MRARKAWAVIGISGGAALALAGALSRGPATRPAASSVARSAATPTEWNFSALSIGQGKASVTYEVAPSDPASKPRFSGYALTFAARNSAGRDVTIPADAAIMRRLYVGGALVDFSTFAQLRRNVVVPAGGQAEITLFVYWNCLRVDAHGQDHEADPDACYRDMWGGTDAFELSDRASHLQVRLPRPPLEN